MNRRLIEKILTEKHEKFIQSIEDENVRNLVNKNSIITGGSIVSLLLKEKVNDYDYYFRDIETVKAVAKYYINQFKKLNPGNNIQPRLWYDNDRVKIIIQSAGVCSENGDKNYRYFESLPDEVGQEWFAKVAGALDEHSAEEIDSTKPPFRPIFMSSNAITLSGKIQLVIRFFGDPEEIHKNYDFIHCCNYWTSWDKKLTLHPAALESILAKQLSYQGSLYPVCSVIRTRKFLKQGWYINAGQILKMLFQVADLDLTNVQVLEEQLTGVDAAYFFQVIEYCKKKQEENPEFKVTTPYLISIIDKIFG
jgi:hypothetical protein